MGSKKNKTKKKRNSDACPLVEVRTGRRRSPEGRVRSLKVHGGGSLAAGHAVDSSDEHEDDVDEEQSLRDYLENAMNGDSEEGEDEEGDEGDVTRTMTSFASIDICEYSSDEGLGDDSFESSSSGSESFGGSDSIASDDIDVDCEGADVDGRILCADASTSGFQSNADDDDRIEDVGGVGGEDALWQQACMQWPVATSSSGKKRTGKAAKNGREFSLTSEHFEVFDARCRTKWRQAKRKTNQSVSDNDNSPLQGTGEAKKGVNALVRENRGDARPGDKKKLKQVRKEALRKERAKRMMRGNNIHSVNAAFVELIVEEGDMHAFPPMGAGARRVIHMLAQKYFIHTSSSGSGKRRCTMARRTKKSRLPEGDDAKAVQAMLRDYDDVRGGVDDGDPYFDAHRVKSAGKKARNAMQKEAALRAAMQAGLNMFDERRRQKRKNSSDQRRGQSAMSEFEENFTTPAKKGKTKSKSKSNVSQESLSTPVAFVSGGDVNKTPAPARDSQSKTNDTGASPATSQPGASGTPSRSVSKDFGKFEQHTKGFGLKMLTKMGFKGAGSGLGKGGEGIAEPVQLSRRKKQLGLGMD